jgi:acyl carrier protein
MKIIKLLLMLILLTCLAATAFGGEALDAARAGDFDKAFKLWSIEAANGDPSAQYGLGVLYYSGDGVPQDYNAAAKWYRKAAEQGDAMAQHNLGSMYIKGKGVPQDSQEAFKWFRLAAEQGEAFSQSNLGYMYFSGDGVLQSHHDGYAWTLVAQANGHAMASDNLEVYRKSMSPDQIEMAQYQADAIGTRLAKSAERRSKLAQIILEADERRVRLANSSNATIEKRTAFEKKFISVLSEQFGGEPEKLTYESRFREDLGADDLDVIELLMALEEYFDIGVGDAQWASATTFGAAVDLLFEIKESGQSISSW